MAALKAALAAAGLVAAASMFAGPAAARPRGKDAGPVAFPDGVASGDVRTHDAILWTRAERATSLVVEVSTDAGFPLRGTIRHSASARASDDATVRVRVGDLAPATQYSYRFVHTASGSTSAVGRFRTAPRAPDAASVRFAWTGDLDGTRVDGVPAFNRFETLDAVRAELPDFFVALGDTIYADSAFAAAPAVTLAEFRAKHRENRGYAALRNLLSATSTYAIWDDHEVVNDFDPVTTDGALIAAGRQAFEENWPLRDWSRGVGFFRHFRWGKEVEVFVLDERSFRSESALLACQGDPFPALPAELRVQIGLPAEPPAGGLETLNDPARTMLGKKQKELFKRLLARSDATWKFVVNEVAMTEQFLLPYDRWDGYPAERREILSFIADEGIGNVVFLTTDQHVNVAADVRLAVLAGTPVVAREFIAGPVAEFTLLEELEEILGEEQVAPTIGLLESLNPPAYANYDTFGYGLVEVDTAAGTATVTLKDAAGTTLHQTILQK